MPGSQWSRVVSLLRLGHMLSGSSCASWCSGISQDPTLDIFVGWDKIVCLTKSMTASLWSKTQGSHLGVRKKALDLDTEAFSVSLGSVAYQLCDFGQITAPL